MDPQLMGPAGGGLQLQQAPGRALLQQTVSGSGRLAQGVDAPEETGLGTAPDGHIYGALWLRWRAVYQAMIDFVKLPRVWMSLRSRWMWAFLARSTRPKVSRSSRVAGWKAQAWPVLR